MRTTIAFYVRWAALRSAMSVLMMLPVLFGQVPGGVSQKSVPAKTSGKKTSTPPAETEPVPVSAPPLVKAISRADLAKDPDATLKARKVALLVGISDYKEEITNLPNLNYTVKDMLSVAEVLKAQGYTISLLQESEATATQIRSRVKSLSTLLTKPNESTFLFYFSGHGFALEKENYLATYGTTAKNLQEQGLPVSELYDLLEKSGVRQRMVIVDACRNDPSKKSVVANRTIERFDRARGTKIMFSTAPGQYSYEDSQLKQGLFTHFLLEGLRGGAAAPDGLISWSDLTSFIETKMADFSASDGNRIQIPYTTGESTGDFLLARRSENYVLESSKPAPITPQAPTQLAASASPNAPPPATLPTLGSTLADEMGKSGTIRSFKESWRSAMHGGTSFNFSIDDDNIFVYSGNDLLGTLKGKVDKKTKKVVSYEGKVRIAPASACPQGVGTMKITEITPNVIKGRIEEPVKDSRTGALSCNAFTFGISKLLGPEVIFVKQN